MKTIGLLGGMSWESTQIYYRELNQQIGSLKGGLHSAEMVLYNVDFQPIEELMLQGEWGAIATILTDHASKIERAGADFLVIATNTMHKLAPEIATAIDIPLLHIADAVGHELSHKGIKSVGLLGTAFTMEEDFYRDRLIKQFGINTLIPAAADRKLINQVIFDELCHGQFLQSSKQDYLAIIDKLAAEGAEAIILGCTEIGLLVSQSDTKVPLVDATFSHINQIVKKALDR
ncbi:MAG: aspartate/glutamate racemase family protein [Marinicella sp.]